MINTNKFGSLGKNLANPNMKTDKKKEQKSISVRRKSISDTL